MRFLDDEWRFAFLFASMVLYAVCLPLESICINGSCNAWPAWGILLFGWLGLWTPANLSWFANPLLISAWINLIRSKRTPAIVCATLALVLGVSVQAFKSVIANESGFPSPISGYRAGYWIWLASIGLACIGAVLLKRKTLAASA